MQTDSPRRNGSANASAADRRAARNTTPPAQRRISVALGGGGARGFAHVGVLQALTENGLKVDHVAGVSIGAIAGALWALQPDMDRLKSDCLAFVHTPAFRKQQAQMFGVSNSRGGNLSPKRWMGRIKKLYSAHQKVTRALRRNAILPESALLSFVSDLLPDINIEDLPVRFSVVAVDILSGRRVVLDRGPLRDAVRASSSVPGFFPPVPWGDDMLLCDIGVYESVPTITAKERASDLTLAVDVANQQAEIDGCENILEVFNRVQELAEIQLRQHCLVHADLVVRPNIERRHWFDFSNAEQLIRLGYEATVATLAETQLVSQPLALAGT